ncbi:hypothetical protein QR721_09500 [Aciduricibacillus chroicocephali]|uniref:Uncharacterized protein n=1 Tax=Aciduricibacillus chroicocephali TaxID=3054939 RepID=A0ABY9KZ88_9BACI|nr:hypothetical protein QR721_09500 [Bacillaceae bacterium 44XB]
MMEFLYFPEDKTEYIPAFIMLVIFMIGAIAAMMYFYKKSKKEEKLFEARYMSQDFSEEKFSSEQKKQLEASDPYKEKIRREPY